MIRTSISWSTIGRVYWETDLETADLDTVILDLLEGQFAWSPSAPLKSGRKISQKTIAQELRRRCDLHCTRAARHIEAGMSNPRAVRYRRLALVEQDNEKADYCDVSPTNAS
jgi:hypothetical protein